MVARELGVPVGVAFSEFDEQPMAVGSVASVHRARLIDGRPVAVKLLTPGVARSIRADLHWVRRIALVAERVPGLRSLPIVRVVDEVGASLLGQVDFEREANANRRLRAALSAMPAVIIPTLVEELCTPSMITMQFVDAFAEPPVRRGSSDRESIRAGIRALFQMIFVEGFVHCDMHEGNLRCLPDGRIAVVDFGFVVSMNDDVRSSFAEFFFAMASGNGAWCADIALELADGYPATLDRAAFADDIAAVVGAAAGRRVGEFDVAHFVGSLFEIQRRHRVRATPAFVMAIVGLLVVEGLAKQIAPDLDFQREALPFISAANIWSGGSRSGDVASVQRRYRRGKGVRRAAANIES